MRYFSKFQQVVSHLCVMVLALGLATGKTIDEIIAGSSKNVADFDLMADVSGNILRVELDMMMTVEQYQALYSSSDSAGSPSRIKRKAIRPEAQRWTNKEIPFRIEASTFSPQDQAEIQKAIEEWQNQTCISFRRARSSDKNFVNFEDGAGCSSYVGMNRDKHPISLAVGCRTKGVIAHEIGHAVGFYHEQNRPDRDDYITLHLENLISETMKHNFLKYPSSDVSTFDVPYDYMSIMHYGSRAFSVNDLPTIKTKDPAFQDIIGNRLGLSFNDIKLANLMYKCNDNCNQNIICPGDGFVGKDCQCWCRDNPVKRCAGTVGQTTTKRITTTPSGRSTVRPTSTTPSGRSTVRPTSKTCVDMNENCRAWADAGYCRTNSYVKTYCQDSCNLCREVTTSASICRDLRVHCKFWAEQSYCTASIYKVFMSEKCPMSCGICTKNLKNEMNQVPGNGGLRFASFSLVTILLSVVCSLV